MYLCEYFSVIKHLIACFQEHGYWDLESISLQSTLAIDKQSLTEIFMDAGLKSLGEFILTVN